MTQLPKEKLDAMETRFLSIEARMNAQPDPEEYVRLSREYAELEPLVEAIRNFHRLEAQKTEAEALRASPDPEMRELADAEATEIGDKLETLTHEIRLMLLPRDEADDKSVILELRAGTGGDEAALFAGDLYRMYARYAELHGWRVSLLSESPGDAGGFKEIIANVTGKGVYARLKFESGVHRVQRVPETEASGRIHTSAATVAVLPEVEDIDIDIKPEDIRIDTMRASGAGGQHVNTTDSAVRITHLASGIVVTASEKSQHQNRATAMKVLRARLFETERDRRATERADSRRGQVGSGDRSERIRTYNFPQGRVTDHRINLTLYKLERVLAGDALDELVEALITEHQAALMAEMETGH